MKRITVPVILCRPLFWGSLGGILCRENRSWLGPILSGKLLAAILLASCSTFREVRSVASDSRGWMGALWWWACYVHMHTFYQCSRHVFSSAYQRLLEKNASCFRLDMEMLACHFKQCCFLIDKYKIISLSLFAVASQWYLFWFLFFNHILLHFLFLPMCHAIHPSSLSFIPLLPAQLSPLTSVCTVEFLL